MAEASVRVTMTGDESRLRASQRRAAEGQNAVTTATRRSGGAYQRTGQQQKSYFGGITKGMIAVQGMMMASKGMSVAIELIGDAMAYTRRETKEAISSFSDLHDHMRKIRQLKGTAQEQHAMAMQAEQLAKGYGIAEERGIDIGFTADSLEVQGFLQKAAKYDPVVAAESSIDLAGKVKAQFASEGISGDEAISAVAIAAQKSAANIEELSDMVATGAASFAMGGSSFVETTAIMSVSAARFKKTTTAAERMTAFAAKFAQMEGFAGLGVIEQTKKLTAMSPEERAGILKESKEVKEAYEILSSSLGLMNTEIVKGTNQIEHIRGGGRSAMSLVLEESLSIDTPTTRRSRNELERRKAEYAEEIDERNQFLDEGVAIDTATSKQQSSLSKRGARSWTKFAVEGFGDMGASNADAETAGFARRAAEAALTSDTKSAAAFKVGQLSAIHPILGFFHSMVRSDEEMLAATREQTDAIKAGQQHPTGADEPASGGSLRGAQVAEAAMAD